MCILVQSYYRPQLKMIKSWAFKDTEYSNFYYDLKILNIEHMTHAISVITNLEHKDKKINFDEFYNSIFIIPFGCNIVNYLFVFCLSRTST